MALWMVRAGRHGENEQYAIDNNMVVIGWDDLPDLSKVKSRESLKQLMEEVYQGESPKWISHSTGQLWAFKDSMKKGDLVALPLKTRSAVALGEVIERYKHDPEGPSGAMHARPVKWIRTDIPRNEIGQDLLYSLGAYMTVCQITRNNAEERFKALSEGKSDPSLLATTEPPEDGQDVAEEEAAQAFDLEGYALDQITSYIHSRFLGHDLTRLVNAILRAQGYQTYSSPPGPDGGVDILAGGGTMGFDPPRLCVQVKSGAAPVDVSAVRELEGVMSRVNAERGLFVSWSGFKDSVYREVKHLFFKLRLWDSKDLVQTLLEHYDKLPEDIQAEIPLKRTWTLVLED